MAFSETSRNIYLDGSILAAECLNEDGEFIFSQLDLDSCLGNIDGNFEWGQQAWSESANSAELRDTYLMANLIRDDGYEQYVNVNLDDYISNINGVLTYTW